MKPIGALMKEHRLIERMVALLGEELRKTSQTNKADPAFINIATDFFRTYADRTHHGKEEDILFRDLAKKNLSPEHIEIMNELTKEHVLARKIVGNLVSANKGYVQNNMGSLEDVVTCLKDLVELYPKHIEKEDKHFFHPCMEYFSQREQDSMLQEFWNFDKQMIHEKYQKMVEQLGK